MPARHSEACDSRVEVVKSEDRGHGVVQPGGTVFEQGAQLVIAQERTIGAQGVGPPERVKVRLGLAGHLHARAPVAQLATQWPASTYDRRRRLPFNGELHLHR